MTGNAMTALGLAIAGVWARVTPFPSPTQEI
jgi:hypothetical protein